MSGRIADLDRARKVFAMQARIREVELSRLRRKVEEIKVVLTEMEAAMISPLVIALPIHSALSRQHAAWQQLLSDTDCASTAQLGLIVDRRSRERFIGLLCDAFVIREARVQAENDLLEHLSQKPSASFPQGPTD